jgi:glycosidase
MMMPPTARPAALPNTVLALLALALLLAVVSPVSAQVRWRLAGTMNSWNTSDEAWTMHPDPNVANRYVIERPMLQGDYDFKFVKDGDWSRGHFGASDPSDYTKLIQPGADLPLTIRANAVYRITLDLDANSWTLAATKLNKPILDTYVFGVPQAHRPFMIDLSRSLTGETPDDEISYSMSCPTDPNVLIEPHPSRPMTMMVTPAVPGPFTLNVTLRAADKDTSTKLEFDAVELYRFLFQAGNTRNAIDLIPVNPDVYRAHFPIAFAMPIALSKVYRGMGDRLELMYESDDQINVMKGNYAIEVRDGVVVTHELQSTPPFLIPGLWHKFSFAPSTFIDSVHLTGDFNQWALEDVAVPLAPSAMDGVFQTVIELPPGAHRYSMLLDNRTRIKDQAAELTDIAPTGEPCSLLFSGPMPEDFPAPQSNNINTNGTNHDPRIARDFRPISSELGIVDIGLTTLPNDVESVYCIVYDSPLATDPSGEIRVPMSRSLDRAGFDRFTARVRCGIPTLHYRFLYKDGTDVQATNPIKIPIDVEPQAPAWAMGATWYQIFPERFRNGSKINDPHGPGVYAARWNSDWYRTLPSEETEWRQRADLKRSDPIPERQGGELYNWIWDRRYGGDLQGVREKLDELKSLGVTAIYFNPIFEAESMHKYDASDFRHIEDNFGNTTTKPPAQWAADHSETEDPATWKWTEADRFFIDEFLTSAHARGIKVVLDGVFNHTGRNFWAFQDVLDNGADSPYADWYYVEFDDQGNAESWRAWDAPSGWLPKFRQEVDGNLVPPVREHIFNITRRWQDPNGDGDPSDGIDGWRLDVALDVGLPFWREWRKVVKDTNPNAIIIAEIWEDASKHLRGDTFDTQMHYPFAHAVTDWLGVRPGMRTEELAQRLESAFNDAPQTALILQNLFASHDTDRYVSMLINPNRGYDQHNRIQDNGIDYLDERPSKEVYELSIIGVAIQATYLGSPMIYYGDEIGMWGADDPTDRKPRPWPDTGTPQNRTDTPLPSIYAKYKHWFNLRKDPTLGPILRYGSVHHIEPDAPDVFIFERRLNGRRVLVVANRGDTPYDATHLMGQEAGRTLVRSRSAESWYFPK